MPYLQLDVPNRYPFEVKRDLARRLGDEYARIMQTTPDLVTVAFRELGEGGVWRCGARTGIHAVMRHTARPSGRTKGRVGRGTHRRVCPSVGAARRSRWRGVHAARE